jgi:ferritin-like metal-binding protein YciE
MDASKRKIVQYLNEAKASEDALVRVLQSQIAMTPRGSYRELLESHLGETRKHSTRVAERVRRLGTGSNPLTTFVGFWEDFLGQGLALSKAPLDLLRGSSGEEKVLKNAKDACATEALEIATYTAIERLARHVGDDQTAKLAAAIRAEEETMLAAILRELPKLADAVAGAEVDGDPSFDVRTTGAGEAVGEVVEATKRTARKTSATTKRTARQARKVPGVAQVEGQVKGAVADEDDLAIADYDSLTVEEINGRLNNLSQIDLAKIDSYERRHQNRTTILSRVSTLRGSEPLAGYDELTVSEVETALAEADSELVERTRTYERAHKDRAGVLKATERELSNA